MALVFSPAAKRTSASRSFAFAALEPVAGGLTLFGCVAFLRHIVLLSEPK